MDMFAARRIQKAFDEAVCLPVGNLSRIVIISDCHRGVGDNADNFARNENIYIAALSHYYKEGFTYIELGDGDELWENRRFGDIIEAHPEAFALLSRFYEQNRLYMIYGNHDIVKKDVRWVRKNMLARYDARKKQTVPLLPDIKLHGAITLTHSQTGGKLFLLHGHQADFFNDTLHPLARFLVRYIWRPLQTIGVTDPTSASKNNGRKHLVEENLINWITANKESSALISGHTHRSIFPGAGEAAYFNDGCCVHTGMVTAIEIQYGMLCLVRWSIQAGTGNILFVVREIIGGPDPLERFFPTDVA